MIPEINDKRDKWKKKYKFFFISIDRIVINTFVNFKIIRLILIIMLKKLLPQRGYRYGYTEHS